MNIFLNGQAQQVDDHCTIAALIKQLDLEHKRLAVEVNCQIIPRGQFNNYTLVADDKLEIVHAIGGG